jgi:hypothetical protein
MRSGCIDPHFIDLGTSWRWVASWRPGSFTPGERAPGTYCIGGLVDPRAGLDNMGKWKFLTLPGLETRPLSRPARSRKFRYISYFIHGCYMSQPSHTPIFYEPDDIRGWLHNLKFVIFHISPLFSYFLSFDSKYTSQRHVLKEARCSFICRV